MITCTYFKPIEGQEIVGYADILVNDWGVIISGISVCLRNGEVYVKMPYRSYNKDGKKGMIPFVRMHDPEKQKEFMQRVSRAILEEMGRRRAEGDEYAKKVGYDG